MRGARKAAAALAAGVLALLAGGAAVGAEHPPDEDGVVPVFATCDEEGLWTATHVPTKLTEADGGLHASSFVLVNECLMAKEGFGPKEVMATLLHEMAHSRGWDHCEGTPEANRAFWPYADRPGVGC